jgi:hypothetical protein
MYKLFFFNNIWFWRCFNHWWNHYIFVCINLQENPIIQLWLFLFLIILKNNLLWIFLNILLGLHLLVPLFHHLQLQLYRIISDFLLHLLKLCLYLSCWVTRSQLSQRKAPTGALADSLTSPGHPLRENKLSIEEIKMMQFSTKKTRTN